MAGRFYSEQVAEFLAQGFVRSQHQDHFYVPATAPLTGSLILIPKRAF